MAFVEDFAPFFSDFGVPCTPESGAAVDVILDRAYIARLGGEISAAGPVAVAQSTDVADWPAHETIVTISGTRYVLRDLQPDGTGLTTLALEEVA